MSISLKIDSNLRTNSPFSLLECLLNHAINHNAVFSFNPLNLGKTVLVNWPA